MTRPFVTVFGVEAPGQTVDRVAVEAVRQGYAVVPLRPGTKVPDMCTLTARELKAAGPDHDCGVHHAITDDAVARRVFQRMQKAHTDPLNIGVVAWPSRLIVIDADTQESVDGFLRDWADAEGDEGYLAHSPTVLTPGALRDGEWRHKDGGHWYFAIPEGVELELGRGVLVGDSGYEVRWGWSMTVAPPSVRSEGPYKPLGDVVDAPRFLIERIEASNREREERLALRGSMFANDAIAEWSMSVSWAELLVPDGWRDTSKIDRSCGCPIFEKPGGGSSTYKSATGHDGDCERWENVEGHGPLHLWTTDPPAPLDEYLRTNGKTITKLRYVALTRHGDDIEAAKTALGLAPDLYGWLVSEDRQQGPADVVSVSDPVSADDADDADDPYVSDVVSEVVSTDQGGPADDGPVSDVVNEIVSEPVSGASFGDTLLAVLGQVMTERGVPETFASDLKKDLMTAVRRDIVSETVSRAKASASSDLSSWLPSSSFVEDFVSGAPEGAEPTILRRSDDKGLLYRGRINTIVARRGAGKTWAAIAACIDTLEAGGRVLYFDMEDTRSEWRARFVAVGFDIDTAVREGRAVWIKPEGLPVADIAEIVSFAGSFDLVVFDVMNRLTIRLGGDPDVANQQVMWLYDNLFDPIALHDACVLVLDHPNRKGQRSDAGLDDLSPGGGAMKMNNASGHVIAMLPTTAFSKDRAGGDVRLVTLKDRCGHFEEGADVARLVGSMDVGETLFMRLRVEMPTEAEQVDEDEVALREVKDRIVALIEKHGPSKRGQLQSNVTSSKRPKFDWAVGELLEEGVLAEDADGTLSRADD